MTRKVTPAKATAAIDKEVKNKIAPTNTVFVLPPQQPIVGSEMVVLRHSGFTMRVFFDGQMMCFVTHDGDRVLSVERIHRSVRFSTYSMHIQALVRLWTQTSQRAEEYIDAAKFFDAHLTAYTGKATEAIDMTYDYMDMHGYIHILNEKVFMNQDAEKGAVAHFTGIDAVIMKYMSAYHNQYSQDGKFRW